MACANDASMLFPHSSVAFQIAICSYFTALIPQLISNPYHANTNTRAAIFDRMTSSEVNATWLRVSISGKDEWQLTGCPHALVLMYDNRRYTLIVILFYRFTNNYVYWWYALLKRDILMFVPMCNVPFSIVCHLHISHILCKVRPRSTPFVQPGCFKPPWSSWRSFANLIQELCWYSCFQWTANEIIFILQNWTDYRSRKM